MTYGSESECATHYTAAPHEGWFTDKKSSAPPNILKLVVGAARVKQGNNKKRMKGRTLVWLLLSETLEG